MSQFSPVNFPYFLRLWYSLLRSSTVGSLSRAVYPGFAGGNISETGGRKVFVVFRFLHWHSTSVLLRL